MNDERPIVPPAADADDIPEVDLSDEDILDAMQHIPGYLDITTEDFREVYHLAHRHALDRLLGSLRAATLMRADVTPLPPDMPLDEAARRLVRSGYKGLPVVDADHRVIGMLTETDYLRRLQADTFLELLLRLLDDNCGTSTAATRRRSRGDDGAAVTPAPIGFATERPSTSHPGRGTPVVDADGHLYCCCARIFRFLH